MYHTLRETWNLSYGGVYRTVGLSSIRYELSRQSLPTNYFRLYSTVELSTDQTDILPRPGDRDSKRAEIASGIGLIFCYLSLQIMPRLETAPCTVQFLFTPA